MNHDTKTLTRFLSKLRVLENGCWEYTGYCMPTGHGQFFDGFKVQLAYRWMYEICNAEHIRGLDIHHLCEYPPCVNPRHLAAKTRREHIALSPRSKSYRACAEDVCTNGHPLTADNVAYTKKNGYRYCPMCKRAIAARRRAEVESKPSPFKNVYWSKSGRNWRAVIYLTKYRQEVHLGSFADPTEAAYVAEQARGQLVENSRGLRSI